MGTFSGMQDCAWVRVSVAAAELGRPVSVVKGAGMAHRVVQKIIRKVFKTHSWHSAAFEGALLFTALCSVLLCSALKIYCNKSHCHLAWLFSRHFIYSLQFYLLCLALLSKSIATSYTFSSTLDWLATSPIHCCH